MVKVETSPARGMRDLLPSEVESRSKIAEVILRTYREHGFNQIETPAVENLERLIGSGGGDNEKLVFKILKRGEKLSDLSDEGSLADLGLRFDLTVPLARYYAQNFSKLPSVFRSIQIGPVWRAERPQKGRFRQFVQCDIDIIAEPNVTAELELISTSLVATSRLGINDLTLRYNHRKFLDQLLPWSGVAQGLIGAALIILDKLDKIGVDGVSRELIELGVDEAATSKLVSTLLEISTSDALPHGLFEEMNLSEAVQSEISAIATLGHNGRFGDVRFLFDPTVIRGMGYYTGAIFELGVSEFGFSIGGGGRYDNMLERFGRPAPACGFSLGFERIALYLSEQKFEIPDVKPLVRVRCENWASYGLASEFVDRAIGMGATAQIEGSSRKLESALRSYRSEYGARDTKPPWEILIEVAQDANRIHRIGGEAPEFDISFRS